MTGKTFPLAALFIALSGAAQAQVYNYAGTIPLFDTEFHDGVAMPSLITTLRTHRTRCATLVMGFLGKYYTTSQLDPIVILADVKDSTTSFLPFKQVWECDVEYASGVGHVQNGGVPNWHFYTVVQGLKSGEQYTWVNRVYYPRGNNGDPFENVTIGPVGSHCDSLDVASCLFYSGAFVLG